MCGIAAMVRAGGGAGGWDERERGRMRRALARLARRGPDGEGMVECAGGRAMLGHRRLAIQDVSEAAAQPMALADGSLTITYNGELYNAGEVREDLRARGVVFRSRSDTEVLLHALDAWGMEGALARVRGMFAFVAVRWDGVKARVMAAVDAAGMKPLAWAVCGSGESATLVCASDCDAVRELMAEKPPIDPVGLCHVLSVGYCPAAGTVWRGVRKLGAGCCLEWDGEGELRVRRYWWPPVPGEGARREKFEELLGRLAVEHLVGDVPVEMFLSAGLDSSSIALALKHAGVEMGSIGACTLSTEAATDEAGDAARLAAGLGMRHRVVRFEAGEVESTLRRAAEAFDEPQGYTAVLTATRIAESVRRAEPGLKVVLGGDGGDEALGGYAWHRVGEERGLAEWCAPTAGQFEEQRMLARRVGGVDATGSERMAALHALGRLSYVHRYLVRTFGGFHPAEARALLAGLGAEYDENVFAGWLASLDAPELAHPRRAQRLDVLGFCAGSILPKLDRACMAVGLEMRAPYLDRRMLEWGLSLPVDPREGEVGKLPVRAMLGRGVERGLVPREILARPKQGFSLRLEDGAFDVLERVVRESRLVRDGVLRGDWDRFLVRDPGARRVRVFTLAMVAGWYEGRA